jgi:hypothetical protein
MRLNWTRLVALVSMLLLLAACAPGNTLSPDRASIWLVHIPTPNNLTETPVGYTFTGTVVRGRLFTQNLAPNLTFQLIPLEAGWEIWVGDPTIAHDPSPNFAMPVTPPFSGINARQIEGWHFRNLDNSGPNEAGEKNVNAPQELRPFCFVGNHGDFQSVQKAFAAGLPALADAVVTGAFPIYKGTLTINELTLGNLLPDQQAWIEEMSFTVTLNLDQPCDLL